MFQNKNVILFMPFIGGGGVEKNLFLISNFLSKKLNKIFLVTSSKKYKKKFDKKVVFLTPEKNLSEGLNIRFKYIVCLYILFKFLLKNKNSIVLSFQANIYCIILCKIFGIKIICRSNSSPSGWYHNFLKKNIYKIIIKMANLIIVNSKEFKTEMKKKFNVDSIYIYNPLNKNEILKNSKRKIKFKYFENKKNLKILNIGRLTEQKDQLTLLKAINRIKNHKLNIKVLIIGRGIEKKNLKLFINKNNLNNIVKIINFQDNPYPYIQKCDLFILTSKYEGLPNVLLEAALLKKFIISSKCPTGPKEILNNGESGYLFKVGDYKELSSKILKFVESRKDVRRKIINAYKNLNRFNYKKNMKLYYLAIKEFVT